MMNEIDFDELDREVSRAMSGITNKKTTHKEGPEASDMHVGPHPAHSGRYMDMVHPSSDMRRSQSSTHKYSASRPVVVPYPQKPIARPAPAKPLPRPVAPKPTPRLASAKSEDRSDFGIVKNVSDSLAAEEEFIDAPGPMRDDFGDITKNNTFDEDVEPNANNYSLGGKSPFIPDAKVDKRPLGDFIPEGSVRGVHSTKNVYSQRTPTNQTTPDSNPMVVEAPKHRSGWVWALVTLGVIAVGGGLGVLAYTIYSNL